MQQLQSVWQALDGRRRIVVLVATIAMFAAVLAISRMAASPTMSLLYAGLESGPAGEVVRALDQRGVRYLVRGDSIWVDEATRDELRMTLAAEGLPANGTAGYELLDGLSGFGTTSQMFDAAYWRAKEGELARTIVASPNIRAARVHISASQPQPFRQEAKPTASVTITTGGGNVPLTQVKALRYLIASAVSGLSPADVTIIDSTGGLLQSGEDAPNGAETGDGRAADLKRNVERLLAARVGAGNAVVEVSVETVNERESIVEKHYDPQGRVAISTDTEERTNSANDQGGGGAVTVASNLPNGDTGQGRSTSQTKNNETRERINYEVSETKREVIRTPGAIRRLTVAVLLDGIRGLDPSGAPTWLPRPDEEMSALHDLVASTVGFDAARGDVITIKTLAFEPVSQSGTTVDASLLGGIHLDPMSALQLAVLALVALVLGVFVVRPILASSNTSRRVGLPPPEGAAVAGAQTNEPSGSARVLTGEIDEGQFTPNQLAVVSREESIAAERKEQLAENADPVRRLRRLIEERQAETVEILRGWMEDREESA